MSVLGIIKNSTRANDYVAPLVDGSVSVFDQLFWDSPLEIESMADIDPWGTEYFYFFEEGGFEID